MRRFCLVAVTLVLAACGSTPSAPGGRLAEEALAYNQRGAKAFERGDYAAARGHYERALEIDTGLDNAEGVAVNSLSLARVHQSLGEASAAHQYLETVLRSQAAAEWRAEAAARKAQLHLAAGETARAGELAGVAFGLCGSCRAQAAILNIGARVALAGGEAALAVQRAERALQAPARDDTRAERANSHRILGEAKLAQGETAAAMEAFRAALRIDQALGLAPRIQLDLKMIEAAGEALRQQPLASPGVAPREGVR